jgi:tRNA A-37 threonylcarbamoyl transferase component Bud32
VGQLTKEQTLSYIGDLGLALNAFHSHGIIHGDIAIKNVLLDQVADKVSLLIVYYFLKIKFS